jgi:hypothetical protein
VQLSRIYACVNGCYSLSLIQCFSVLQVSNMQAISHQPLPAGSKAFPQQQQHQQQQPTSLELAEHTMQELQLMARPLKATMVALSEECQSSGEGKALDC